MSRIHIPHPDLCLTGAPYTCASLSGPTAEPSETKHAFLDTCSAIILKAAESVLSEERAARLTRDGASGTSHGQSDFVATIRGPVHFQCGMAQLAPTGAAAPGSANPHLPASSAAAELSTLTELPLNPFSSDGRKALVSQLQALNISAAAAACEEVARVPINPDAGVEGGPPGIAAKQCAGLVGPATHVTAQEADHMSDHVTDHVADQAVDQVGAPSTFIFGGAGAEGLGLRAEGTSGRGASAASHGSAAGRGPAGRARKNWARWVEEIHDLMLSKSYIIIEVLCTLVEASVDLFRYSTTGRLPRCSYLTSPASTDFEEMVVVDIMNSIWGFRLVCTHMCLCGQLHIGGSTQPIFGFNSMVIILDFFATSDVR